MKTPGIRLVLLVLYLLLCAAFVWFVALPVGRYKQATNAYSDAVKAMHAPHDSMLHYSRPNWPENKSDSVTYRRFQRVFDSLNTVANQKLRLANQREQEIFTIARP